MQTHYLNPYGFGPAPIHEPKVHKKSLKKYVLNAPKFEQNFSNTLNANSNCSDFNNRRGLSLSKNFNNYNQMSDYKYNFGTNTICSSISDYGRKQNMYYTGVPTGTICNSNKQMVQSLGWHQITPQLVNERRDQPILHKVVYQNGSLHKFQTFGQLKNSVSQQVPEERISLKRYHSVGHYYNRCSISNKFSESDGFHKNQSSNEYFRGSIIDQLKGLEALIPN